MKKLTILSLMIISALSVDAQRKRTRTATSQGNVVVRLGMGVNFEKNDPDDTQLTQPITRTTDINFSPSIGYMVVDNLELGVNLSVMNHNSEDVINQNPTLIKTVSDTTTVGFGVYAQKYFPLNNWFALTTSADLGLSTGTYSTDTVNGAVTAPVPNQTGNLNTAGGGINFGFSFTPYNALALQANIAGFGVKTTKTDPDGVNNAVNNTKVGFNVWRQPYNMSVVFFFGRGLWKK